MKKKRLIIPAALSVALLAACPSEPEHHEHEVCFCEVSQEHPDAGTALGPDSGCTPPSERTCAIV